MSDDLSGNPSSIRPTQIARQLDDFAQHIERDAAFKAAFAQLCPDICPCCFEALLADAAVFLRQFALTPEGIEAEAYQ